MLLRENCTWVPAGLGCGNIAWLGDAPLHFVPQEPPHPPPLRVPLLGGKPLRFRLAVFGALVGPGRRRGLLGGHRHLQQQLLLREALVVLVRQRLQFEALEVCGRQARAKPQHNVMPHSNDERHMAIILIKMLVLLQTRSLIKVLIIFREASSKKYQ